MSRFFQKMSTSDFVQQALNELKDLVGKLDKLEALRPSDAGKHAHACIMQGIGKINGVLNKNTADKTSAKEDAMASDESEQKTPRMP